MKNLLFFLLYLTSLSLSAQNLYTPNELTLIHLTFQEDNWNEILQDYYANDDGERLIANCTINGESFSNVGVRYKGNATYSTNNAKNPMNIKLDFVDNQDYQNYETIKLSNGQHDPSFLREILSYEIARKYMVAPQANYAQVYINGDYWGLFSSSENIGGAFGESYLYADKDNPRIKCNSSEGGGPFAGGSALTYLGTDSTDYYSSYDMDSDDGWAALLELIDVLNHDPQNIESVLDMDRAIWMMAFNNVLVNLDSYIGRKQNYYLLKDDNGVFNPILWDMNESFGAFESAGPGQNTNLPELNPLVNATADYPLMQLIANNDTYRRMYIAHCRTILEENFSNDWYKTRGMQLQNLISEALQSDMNALYAFDNTIANLTNTVSGSGGGGPGSGNSQGAIGITELMEERVTFLQNHELYMATPPTITNLSSFPNPVNENSPASILVTIPNAENVILGYRFNEAEEFIKVNMLDDGTQGDGAANDGIFGYTLDIQTVDVQYFIYAENDEAGVFSPVRAAFEYHNLEVFNVGGDLVINELMASNDATMADQDGEYDDWIELYNNTNAAISLDGYFLSDDENDLMKWAFPNETIAANDFRIVWADNDEEQAGMHANFKLSAGGETLFLVASDGTIVDEVTFGEQVTDISYGRFPNGTGDFRSMVSTFNATNSNMTATTELEEDAFFIKISPNPTSDWLEIEVENTKEYPVEIYNVHGQLMLKESMRQMKRFWLGDVEVGIYFVKIGEEVKRVVVM